MANELALIKNETALTHLAAVAAQAQEMRLLKFSKGNWLIGDDELSADRLFIAHVHQLAHGWVKFIDGKVADQRVGVAQHPGLADSGDPLVGVHLDVCQVAPRRPDHVCADSGDAHGSCPLLRRRLLRRPARACSRFRHTFEMLA